MLEGYVAGASAGLFSGVFLIGAVLLQWRYCLLVFGCCSIGFGLLSLVVKSQGKVIYTSQEERKGSTFGHSSIGAVLGLSVSLFSSLAMLKGFG